MTSRDLILELSRVLDSNLAKDLVCEFIELRMECQTGTLGRSSLGKFVETVVQVLQYLDMGKYDAKPSVDDYLKNIESRSPALAEDLRICCARIARSVYTLRNKRNILHKGELDPSLYDLRYAYSACQWILSEILRYAIKSDKELAGGLVEFVQIPVSPVVEDLDGRKIVYGDLTVEKELLVLLHSHYPEAVRHKDIQVSMDRRSKSAISNSLKKLWEQKLVHRTVATYKLTQEGYKAATSVIKELIL
ncbi:MAG: hypothetical protein A2283_06290 [Lentisphaerae bacterium RIFOXYA12_FULL_48_11]|nr:MAG: hypothetical protein A2283_06290 [Lentisphaerae bacterium RIFOXYA12_FULL_48_11]